MIRLIIFDLDGTLVNAYPAVSSSINDTLSRLGFKKRTHADIKRSVGWGDRHLLAGYVGEALADKAIRFYRPHHAKALTKKGGVRFLAGAKTALKGLKRNGYQLAIASNRPTRFTKLILKTLEAHHYFDAILCADKAARPKPHPDMLLEIMRRLKKTKAQTLFVGDMTIDVQTGKRAGVKTVAVTTGSSGIKALKALKPFRIINRIDAIKIIIKSGEQS